MKRRSWKYLLVISLLVIVAMIGTESLQNRSQSFAPLDHVIAQDIKNGWRLGRAPDSPGPYQRGDNSQFVNRGSVASIAYTSQDGPVNMKLPVRDDVEQLILPLQTADGKLTIAVLER